jgi:hypothetical protein
MAMHPALIAGQALTGKSWREAARGRLVQQGEPSGEPGPVPAHVLDTVAELRSLGHLTHRFATLCAASSVALLWVTNWLGFAANALSLTTMVLGIGSALLAVLLALAAFALELLTRVRIEHSPRLTTLAEHRNRIEAESAAFRDSLPAVEPPPERPPRRRRRRGRLL